MLPNPQDSTFIKIVKIFAIFVFPTIIVGLLVVISFVPAPKKSAAPTARSIDVEIQRLIQEKAKLGAH